MRQTAWLSTAPEKANSKDKLEPVSRLKAMRQRGEEPMLPPNPAEYLTDWLFEIGPTIPTGMGEVPLTFGDLAAWQDVMGIELEPWEARLLKSLSGDFVDERYHARKRDRPAPWSGIESEPEAVRDKVSRQIRSMFGLKQK